ncbi:MAG: hypothetical protein EXX96DRAFT_548860 [Benjaminiella poitrasii]|nr:MAG: hypothetical protein EXX96DRAFT_548860 [Benjaminiella poitrasii]
MEVIEDCSNYANKRHRRYTIARPASALALLTDQNEEDQQFDRISDILSALIQEANEAVNHKDEGSMTGGLPMVRKLSSSSSERKHPKRRKPARLTSTRPVSYPSSSTLYTRRSMIPVPSPVLNVVHSNNGDKPMHSKRSSITTSVTHKPKMNKENVLLESFKRLDSSLAVIDSLSRDLVPSSSTTKFEKDNQNALVLSSSQRRHLFIDPSSRHFSALWLLPLLQVPHILISIVFDSISFTTHDLALSSHFATTINNDNNNSSHGLSSILIWALLFAVTNFLVIDNKNAELPSNTRIRSQQQKQQQQPFLLPGSFLQANKKRISTNKRKSLANSNSKRQDTVSSFVLKRRNSL